jgi:hypothetical protein
MVLINSRDKILLIDLVEKFNEIMFSIIYIKRAIQHSQHRLGVFENRALRKIFESKKDEVVGDGRKLQKGELRNLYFSPSIIIMVKSRNMRWAEHVGSMGTKRNECMILVGKREKKRLLGNPRHRWNENIKFDLRENVVVWTGLNWLRMGTSGWLL